LYSRTAIINLTVSGFTVLPYNYDAPVPPPQITSVVSAADGSTNIAPGSAVSVLGNNLSGITLATSQLPLPTVLADSCLTVNGLIVPMFLASPNQINMQMPFEAVGNVTLVLRTPGGTTNNYNLVVLPGAPAVFYNGTAGPDTNLPTLYRTDDGLLITDSHPIHRRDNVDVLIVLSGLGQANPAVPDGYPAPSSPLAVPLNAPTVTLGGVSLPVVSYVLSPGQVAVNEIDVQIPSNVPAGLAVPLVIAQGSSTTTLSVRVVDN
jgi:uncharacterized protein (TIGR03437 family)